MKIKKTFFHCSNLLKDTLSKEIRDVHSVVSTVKWQREYRYSLNGITFNHQAAYNKAFTKEFTHLGWEKQPLLRKKPKLIGDFRKGLVFVEVQFGNSSTIYRDYYKFQHGLTKGLLSMAVLIVPTNPSEFFPTRPKSVQNMAEYSMAYSCFELIPISVPKLLIGLLPK